MNRNTLERLIVLADAVAAEWSCNCYDGECDRCQVFVRYRNTKEDIVK